MTTTPLQAFLEGRLLPAERARLARRLVSEPALAQAMARLADEMAARPPAPLARLKAWMGPHPPVPEEPPLAADFDPPAVTTGGPQRRAWFNFGTVVLTGLVVLAGLKLLLPADTNDLIRAHRDYIASAPLRPDAGPAVPDLGAAGFAVERVRPMLGGLYIGYAGPPGCRLGLWRGPAGELPSTLPPGWRGRVFYDGDTALWVVTEPVLDAGRFAALAELARAGGGAAVPVDAAAMATPCLEPTPEGTLRPAGARR